MYTELDSCTRPFLKVARWLLIEDISKAFLKGAYSGTYIIISTRRLKEITRSYGVSREQWSVHSYHTNLKMVFDEVANMVVYKG